MKKFVIWTMLLALLLSLCACGVPEASGVSDQESELAAPATGQQVSAAEVGGYMIPASWTENSVNDGTWGYMTAGVEGLPAGNFNIEDGFLVSQSRDQKTMETTLIRCALDGTELNRVTIPPQEGAFDQSVGWYCFGEESLWLTYVVYTMVNEETEQVESASSLQQWSYEGECLTSLSVEESFPIAAGSFVSDLALDPEGNPILIVEQQAFFCDGAGKCVATMELGDMGYGFCQDKDGRLYLFDAFGSTIYTIDWEKHAQGTRVLTTRSGEMVSPGGGDYDFLLKSNTALRGASLSTGTITEILSWADWDLSGSVGGAAYLDKETFLISAYSLLDMESGGQILTLSRVPAERIPVKKVVRLAVGLSAESAEMGMTWTDSLDQMVAEAMNQFNRASDTYRVEVETYSGAEELNLKLISGDAPDIIEWGSTGFLEDIPSLELYAKKGYLTDLEPLFDADQELSTEDFIPSIFNIAKAHTDGFYELPQQFYFTTLSGPKEYVGEETGWGVSDLLEAAKQMPEDMCVIEYWSQADMLDHLLRSSIDRYVDVKTGSCNVQSQEFYDLLTLCRDYFPAEVGENYVPPAGGAMLVTEASLGRLGQFASDIMRPAQAQGRTLIGFPGAGGSGVTIIFKESMSICALGSQQEGAWEFLRTLCGYDYQYSSTGPGCPVRQDAFEAREDWYLEINGSCTEEESRAARQLVYDAECRRVNGSPVIAIIEEEAGAFFAGDKTAEQVAEIIENRVKIYLSEQS